MGFPRKGYRKRGGPGDRDDFRTRAQLPYYEHNFVVHYFDEDNPRHKKDYWLIPTEEMFLEDCRGKKSKRGK